MPVTRIPDEDLVAVRDLFGRLQDNITDADAKAQAAFDGVSGAEAAVTTAVTSAASASNAAAQAADATGTASTAARDASTQAGFAAASASAAAAVASDTARVVAGIQTTVGLVDQRLTVVESRPAVAGGFGPNYVATASSPAELRRAVAAAGGFVGTGVNDHVGLNAVSAKFGEMVAVQGQYGMGGPLAPLARRRIVGWGASTELTAAKGLSGAMVSVTTDHVHLSQFAMVGNAGRADTSTWQGEAAGTDHLVVDNTTKDGFWTGSESTFFADNLVSKNSRGRGIVWSGSFNRDSKISQCHIYNPINDGMTLAVVDGMISAITVGTPGGYGFNFTSKCANLEVWGLKAWYCELDGFLLDTIRCGFSHLQAQDCRKAGFRLLGDGLNTLYNASADSNSYIVGNGNRGISSGLEIGLNAATVAGTPGSKAQYKGNDWTASGLRLYDKREGGDARGYNQRHGALIGAGVTDLTLDNVKTGRLTGTHHNLVGGVVFVDPATRTDASNSFTNVRSHGTLI